MERAGGQLTRRDFLRTGCSVWVAAGFAAAAAPAPAGPNVVLCMADDLGWGDTGYNGHPLLQTPHLDRMSREGIRFDRFYAAAPVCSPTRGSCLTGRHPFRYGIFFANVGHLPAAEVTLAEVLRSEGYATGHFGKWHLGTLTQTVRDANRGGRPGDAEHYSPPWENGFDRCFSTESKVPTFDPMVTPAGWGKGDAAGKPFGTAYWTGPGERVESGLEGDDSRIIMDRALPFMREAVRDGKPFLAVVWFHAPHLPVVAGPEDRALYPGVSEFEQHYYGCITALDRQLGRLRSELESLGVARDTLLWFCSDNGPEGPRRGPKSPGSAGDLRGRKRSLLEGGVRVPGLLAWPARLPTPRTIAAPCSTADFFPTILAALGYERRGKARPEDGENLLPLLEGAVGERSRPLAFESARQLSLVDNRFKVYSADDGKTFALYDIVADPGESRDLSADHAEVKARMVADLLDWRATCKASLGGADY